MTKLIINTGTTPNDRSGDPLRVAFTKINLNFTEVYNAIENVPTDVSDLTDLNNIIFSGNYNDLSNTPFTPSDVSELTDEEDLLRVKTNVELTREYAGTGGNIIYVKTPGTLPTDTFDTISELVSITRNIGTGGIYNTAVESEYDETVSPALTLWNWDGWNDLTDVKNRYYAPFRQILENNVDANVIGAELVMQDTSDGKYYKVKFTAWGQGVTHDGSFSYVRELIDTSENVGITFSDQSTLTKRPDTRVKFPQTYLGNFDNHTLMLNDSGRQIYAYNNNVNIPSVSEQNFLIGSTIQFITGDAQTTLRSKQNNNVDIEDAILYIQNENTPVSSFVIPPRSIGFLTKIRNNTWQFSLGNTSGATNTGDVTFSGVKVIGAGTASGDGAGYSTLELVPDNNLYSNHQYLIVDPTAPSHIHLRAGGPQDNSNAEIFLGGEKNHVKVTDNSGVRIQNEQLNDNYFFYPDSIAFTNGSWYEDAGSYYVSFTTTDQTMINNLFLFSTGSPNQIIVNDGVNSNILNFGGSVNSTTPDVYVVQVLEAPSSSPVSLQSIEFHIFSTSTNFVELRANDFTVNVTDDVRITGRDTFSLRNISNTTPISIRTDYDNNDYVWDFNPDGSMRFPDGTLQTTAFIPFIKPAPTTSKGTVGDTVGFLSFDNSYIYYCVTTYTDGVADIWKRVAWSNDTW